MTGALLLALRSFLLEETCDGDPELPPPRGLSGGEPSEALLVSHARTDITENCQRALWISEGRILRDGPADEVCAAYDAWARGGTPA